MEHGENWNAASAGPGVLSFLSLLPLQALSGDHDENITRTHTQEVVVLPNSLFRWKSAPGFPMSHLPPSCCGKSPTMSSARPNQKPVSTVSASYKSLVHLEPTQSVPGPGSC